MITLDYNETSWLRQPLLTRVESVTPFLVKFWEGSLRFEPDVDVWIDVNRMELRDVLMEGSFLGVKETMGAEVTTHAMVRDLVSHLSFGSLGKPWVLMFPSILEVLHLHLLSLQTVEVRLMNSLICGKVVTHKTKLIEEVETPSGFEVEEETSTNTTTITGTVGVDLQQQRRGKQHTVNEQIDTESLGDRIVSREVIQFMRSLS